MAHKLVFTDQSEKLNWEVKVTPDQVQCTREALSVIRNVAELALRASGTEIQDPFMTALVEYTPAPPSPNAWTSASGLRPAEALSE